MRLPHSNWAYPLEAVRDRYVTRMGGVSYDLQPGEIGVNAEALASNTSLRSLVDRVVVSMEGPRPGLGAPDGETFTVVALEDHHGDARRLSPQGEVVFSAFESDACDDGCVVEWLRRGDAVFLNAALGRWGRVAADWAKRFSVEPARGA